MGLLNFVNKTKNPTQNDSQTTQTTTQTSTQQNSNLVPPQTFSDIQYPIPSNSQVTMQPEQQKIQQTETPTQPMQTQSSLPALPDVFSSYDLDSNKTNSMEATDAQAATQSNASQDLETQLQNIDEFISKQSQEVQPVNQMETPMLESAIPDVVDITNQPLADPIQQVATDLGAPVDEPTRTNQDIAPQDLPEINLDSSLQNLGVQESNQPVALESTQPAQETIQPIPQSELVVETEPSVAPIVDAETQEETLVGTSADIQVDTPDTNLPTTYQQEDVTSETKEIYNEDTNLKIFKSIGLIGLNVEATSVNITEELGNLLSALSNLNIDDYIVDSDKGYGRFIVDSLKKNPQNKVHGVYLKPFYSDYSDNTDNRITDSNYMSNIFSSFNAKVDYLIKSADVFIMPETSGIMNFALLFSLLSINHLYFGQHKPTILFGKNWSTIIDSIKTTLAIKDEDVAYINICQTSEEVINLIKKLDQEYSQNEYINVHKVLDKRNEAEENQYFINR